MWGSLHELASGVLMLIGALLMLAAAIGLVRLPDIYLRMAATSKAATLGAVCVLLALALHFMDIAIATRAIAAVVFLFLTAPIAAHMLGRAAYSTGCPLWEGTVKDELAGHYNPKTHSFESTTAPAQPLADANTEQTS